MKLRCPYCGTIFTKLATPTCPGCGRSLRLMWESDLKTPKARAALRVSQGRRPEPPPRRHRDTAARPPKPHALMIPFLLLNYRSRMFMWTLVLTSLIVARLLFVHVDDVKVMLSDEAGRASRCQKELLALRTGLEWFRTHCKRYPTDAEGLRALVRNPGVPGWHGNYVDQLTSDPWGHPYHYSCTQDTVSLWGAGVDGRDGTADDIISPPPDWHALMERVNVRDLPHWGSSNTAPSQVTSRP